MAADATTGYKIEASPTGADGTWTDLVADTGSTATAYTHTGLTAGTTRHYRVSTINANGTSTPTNKASATTAAAGAPGAPTGLAATASGQTRIDLGWTAPAEGTPTGYRIEVSPNGAAGTWTVLEFDTGSTGRTFGHAGLTASTTRHYRVFAVNAAGTGDPSNEASATTGPRGVLTVEARPGALKVSWTVSTDADFVTVQWKMGEQSFSSGERFADVFLPTSTYTITDLTPGTEYAVQIVRLDGGTVRATQEAFGTPVLGKVSVRLGPRRRRALREPHGRPAGGRRGRDRGARGRPLARAVARGGGAERERRRGRDAPARHGPRVRPRDHDDGGQPLCANRALGAGAPRR